MKRSKHSRSRSRSRSENHSKHKKSKKQKRRSSERHDDDTANSSGNNYGPSLQTSDCYGPAVSNKVKETFPISTSVVAKPKIEETVEMCGPSLPPHMLETKETKSQPLQKVIGPSLPPPGFVSCTDKSEDLESFEDDDDEGDSYGPLPPEATNLSNAHLALEERALQMKIDMLNPDKSVKDLREEWMIELPDIKKSSLGRRQFRANAGPDLTDRSSWTNTPSSKKGEQSVSRERLRQEAESRETLKRDDAQEAMAKKSKRKEKRSLLELHQEKLKNEKRKKSDTDGVRRPFSRDLDLQVNKFDEAQKKSVLRKAQLLDDRFSKGQAKYL